MFGAKNKNLARSGSLHHTLISVGTEIQGDIRFTGELIIEGQLAGNIVADDDSEAVLRIADQGRVDGNISVPVAVVNGSVNGDVRASKQLELGARARVSGTVYYQLLEMVMGARVNGSLVCDTKARPEPRALLRGETYSDTD
ncbi:bactofilin family protein [Pseudohongiella spirulinae]|uniref:Integral membrane protein ccma involved in cell shape determination n=1 Tax=Pseudohongiella spirulinae TaxID=1249552 RepID=A0A0S2KGP1_9GAMM|nr:polymer-forming cytoskeletal protein [Pseudohongiella spirulinae]ALO47122.1 Integral membrane protein ccma involved in cell shape determination [Pseudohongiella spirulinae]